MRPFLLQSCRQRFGGRPCDRRCRPVRRVEINWIERQASRSNLDRQLVKRTGLSFPDTAPRGDLQSLCSPSRARRPVAMSVAPVRTRPGGFSGPQAPALCGPRFSFHAPPHNLPRGRSRRPIPLSRGSLRLGHGFGELRPGPANPHTSAPAPCRRLSFTDGGAWQLKPCRLAAACAMVLPPPHVYSAQLYNHSESEISVEVHYAQHRPDGGDLQEIKCLELRAGEDVPLEEMTRDEGIYPSQ